MWKATLNASRKQSRVLTLVTFCRLLLYDIPLLNSWTEVRLRTVQQWDKIVSKFEISVLVKLAEYYYFSHKSSQAALSYHLFYYPNLVSLILLLVGSFPSLMTSEHSQQLLLTHFFQPALNTLRSLCILIIYKEASI